MRYLYLLQEMGFSSFREAPTYTEHFCFWSTWINRHHILYLYFVLALWRNFKVNVFLYNLSLANRCRDPYWLHMSCLLLCLGGKPPPTPPHTHTQFLSCRKAQCATDSETPHLFHLLLSASIVFCDRFSRFNTERWLYNSGGGSCLPHTIMVRVFLPDYLENTNSYTLV